MLQNEQFRTVTFARKGRPRTLPTLTTLYTEARSINPAKVSDLRKLLQFVPPIYHSFYMAIKGDKKDKTVVEEISDNEDHVDDSL